MNTYFQRAPLSVFTSDNGHHRHQACTNFSMVISSVTHSKGFWGEQLKLLCIIIDLTELRITSNFPFPQYNHQTSRCHHPHQPSHHSIHSHPSSCSGWSHLFHRSSPLGGLDPRDCARLHSSYTRRSAFPELFIDYRDHCDADDVLISQLWGSW